MSVNDDKPATSEGARGGKEPLRGTALVSDLRKLLTRLEVTLDEVADAYLRRLRHELAGLVAVVEARKSKLTKDQSRDLRLVHEWLANLQIKSEKGRRKDLKKIDEMIGRVQSVLEHW
jgi:hypothetical protein